MTFDHFNGHLFPFIPIIGKVHGRISSRPN